LVGTRIAFAAFWSTTKTPVAEDGAAYEATTHTAMDVPVELVPAVWEMLAKRRAG
jgi:hypothetical protein